MVHKFLITAAHTAPIHQRETLEHQIIQGKYPTMSCGPHEESHHFWNLDFPNPLPREARERGTSDLIIKGLNIELTIPTDQKKKSNLPFPLRHQWGLSHPIPLGIRD